MQDKPSMWQDTFVIADEHPTICENLNCSWAFKMSGAIASEMLNNQVMSFGICCVRKITVAKL